MKRDSLRPRVVSWNGSIENLKNARFLACYIYEKETSGGLQVWSGWCYRFL